jgi:hypothetical protein
MAVNRTLLFVGAPSIIKIGGVDVGGTLDGFTVTEETEFFDKTCDQVRGTIGKTLMSRSVTLTFSIVETTLVNMQKALAMPAANLSGSTLYLTDGELTDTTLEMQVVSPTGGTRVYYFLIARILGSGEFSYKKDGQLSVPVTIQAIPDTTQGNKIGYIYDV